MVKIELVVKNVDSNNVIQKIWSKQMSVKKKTEERNCLKII